MASLVAQMVKNLLPQVALVVKNPPASAGDAWIRFRTPSTYRPSAELRAQGRGGAGQRSCEALLRTHTQETAEAGVCELGRPRSRLAFPTGLCDPGLVTSSPSRLPHL